MVGKYGLNLQDWSGFPVARLFGRRGPSGKDHRMPPPDDKPSSADGEIEDQIDEVLGESRYPQLVKSQAVGQLASASQTKLDLPTLPAPEELDTAANPKFQRHEEAPLLGRVMLQDLRTDIQSYMIG